MKKIISFSALFVLAVALMMVAFAPTSQAQTAVNCPVGFVCTPVNPATTNSITQSGNACYVWRENMGVGSRGANVAALVNWLNKNGFSVTGLSNQGSVTVYDESTAAAVVKLQTSVGIPATGYVGPITRAYLNAHSCGNGGTTQQPIVTSITPTNGGSNTTITLYGSGFSSGNAIEFDQNGSAMGSLYGPNVQITSNQITFALGLLGANLSPGTYQVKVLNSETDYSMGVGSNSVSFTLGSVSTTQPNITRISAPASSDSMVYAGSKFSIEGMNLAAPDTVYVGNEQANIIQDATPETNGLYLIWAIAPSDLTSGSSYVYVKNNNGVSNQFNVTTLASTNPICPSGWSCNQTNTSSGHNSSTHIPNSQDEQVTFTKTFNTGSYTGPVTLSVEADNEYSASINGTNVATSNYEENFYGPNTTDVTSYVHQGSNTVSITVTNENYHNGDWAWQDNPGGLAYKITDAKGSVLVSSDGTEQTSYNGGAGSAMVINGSYLWAQLPGASWIWDANLYRQNSNIQTTSVQCPAGYVCSPNTQVYACPAGYVCTPVTISSCPTGYTCYSLTSNTVSISISQISGPSGTTAGLPLIIYGTGFASGDSVSFSSVDGSQTPNVIIPNSITPTQISLYIPSLTPGTYYVVVSGNGVTSNQMTFTITSATNQSPIISSVSGPINLYVGQAGSWTTSAGDPHGGQLTYMANWGDTNCPAYAPCSASQFSLSPTMSHTYTYAGTYNIIFTVRNSSGLAAQKTYSVTVKPSGSDSVSQQTSVVPSTSSQPASVWDAWWNYYMKKYQSN